MRASEFSALDQAGQSAVRNTLFDIIDEAWKLDEGSPLPWALLQEHPALTDIKDYILEYNTRTSSDQALTPEQVHLGYDSYKNYQDALRTNSPDLEYARLAGYSVREVATWKNEGAKARQRLSETLRFEIDAVKPSKKDLVIARKIFPELWRLWLLVLRKKDQDDLTGILDNIHDLEVPPGVPDDQTPWRKLIEFHLRRGGLRGQPTQFDVASVIRTSNGTARIKWAASLYDLLQHYSPPNLTADLLATPS